MKHPLLPAALIVAAIIFIAETFFGFFSEATAPARSEAHYSRFVGSQNWMRVQVDEIPSERERSIRAICDVLEITDTCGATHPCKGKLLLYLQKPSTVAFGDELLVLSSPDLPSGADNPHQFDYRKYLRRKGILYTDYVTSTDYRIIGHNTKGWKSKITVIRQRLINVIHFSQLTPSQQGIAEALILGWDEDIDAETKAHFRTAGITHLLCVSGLHVGIVALLVGWCLFFLSNRRPARIVKGCIQLSAIWAFVFLTGMAPSTMRAALMFSLIVIGQMFFTRPPILNAIAASALILLVTKPLLLFDVGFQLSYTAVLAIVTLVRPLEELMPIPNGRNRLSQLTFKALKKIRSLFCVSLVAQLAVMPLTLFYFHTFPPYFLVANMTVIPLAGLLLGSVLLMLLVAWWPLAFKAVGALTSFLLATTEHITSVIASWPNALIEGIYFDIPMLILSFVIVILLSWMLLRPQWKTLAAILATALALAIYAKHIESKCDTQSHFDVYNVGNRTAIEFFFGHNSYLVCDKSTAQSPDVIDFQTANNLIFRQTKQRTILPIDTTFEDDNIYISNRFISFSGKTFRIIDRSNYRIRSMSHPEVDYLILRESPYITISELLEQYDFDTLIVSSQNSIRRRAAWQQQCDSLGIHQMTIGNNN